MSVVIETTLGDITVDLFLSERPRACLNFLKLCQIKYYNFNLFHTISRSFIAQTGDPTGSRSGGDSIFGVIDGPSKRFFEGENEPRIKHTKMGLISFVGNEDGMIGSQFFLTLGEDLTYLDEKHCVFGEVVEGFDILEMINEVICDTDDRPYQDVRITHTVILDDPYPDPKGLLVPSRSPSPSEERLQGGRIAPDEEIDEMEGKPPEEIAEIQAAKEAKARATILEMVGDLPDAEMAPPENVLFVCKLNPVTSDDDLEIIFSRFGKIKSCEVIRDKKTGDSLQYAFVEFEDQKSCENAYFKMDNVLIDDRRIHVDFSQSVSKIKWHGKGRGVTHYDDKGKKSRDNNNDIGKGNYKNKRHNTNHKYDGARERYRSPKRIRDRSSSPKTGDNLRKVEDDSTSLNRDKNISRHEKDKVPFKEERKDFSSSRRSGFRDDSRENHKYRRRYDERSNNKSLSPKRRSRSVTPRKNRYVSNSPTRRIKSRSPKSRSRDSRKRSPMLRRGRDFPSSSEQINSRHYIESVRTHRNSRSKTPNIDKYHKVSKYNRPVPSSSKTYTSSRNFSNRRERSTSKEKSKIKIKERKTGEVYSRKKDKSKRNKTKYSSDDSDSDSESKKKAKKKKDISSSSSSSSDSEDYQRRKSKKKKHSKKRRDSSSDSDESDNIKKSKKKKKKKYESDSN